MGGELPADDIPLSHPINDFEPFWADAVNSKSLRVEVIYYGGQQIVCPNGLCPHLNRMSAFLRV